MGFRTSAPAPNLGYNRTTDWPSTGGLQAAPAMGGGGMFANLKGQAAPGAPGTWHPTVLWMAGFVVVEMVVFGALSRYLKI
jgi:hypothetical protein